MYFYIAFLTLFFFPQKETKALERGRFLTLTKAKSPTSVKLALTYSFSIYIIP